MWAGLVRYGQAWYYVGSQHGAGHPLLRREILDRLVDLDVDRVVQTVPPLGVGGEGLLLDDAGHRSTVHPAGGDQPHHVLPLPLVPKDRLKGLCPRAYAEGTRLCWRGGRDVLDGVIDGANIVDELEVVIEALGRPPDCRQMASDGDGQPTRALALWRRQSNGARVACMNKA